MGRAELFRVHAQALIRIAENAGPEDRACLLATARDWLRVADKIERDQAPGAPTHNLPPRRTALH
jgi:hypothetical protein